MHLCQVVPLFSPPLPSPVYEFILRADGVVKFTKPGTMEAGGYYASAIMRFAMDLVSQGVEMAEPFSEVVRGEGRVRGEREGERGEGGGGG